MSSIEWLDPKADLTTYKKEQLELQLKEKLTPRCLEAYLFGSFASGEYRFDSDIDLVIVKDTNLPFTERGREFTDLYDVFSRLDLLIYTPEEFQKMRLQNDGFFSTMKVLKQIV